MYFARKTKKVLPLLKFKQFILNLVKLMAFNYVVKNNNSRNIAKINSKL